MDSISGSISHGRREAFDRWLDAVEAHLREYEAEQVREEMEVRTSCPRTPCMRTVHGVDGTAHAALQCAGGLP